jgi:methyl-accepting chemotaxis protein
VKISTRLTIALVIASLAPILLLGLWNLQVLRTALDDMGEEMIGNRAQAVADQIEMYLAAHPDVDLSDTESLQANEELAAIAVQRTGERDYTAVFDDQAITHFHARPEVVGMDLSDLAERLPEFWQVLSASLDGTPSSGYYKWEEDDRFYDKFMSIVAVEGTPLRVAATTYVSEFRRPVNRIYAQLLGSVLLVIALSIVVALLLGRQFSRPILHLVEAAGQIADGDLGVQPPISSPGELGLLATAFEGMTESLSSLIRQVRKMSLNVGGAAGEVVMTQRQHASGAEEQAAAVANASAAVQELATSSAQIATSAEQVVAAAGQTQSNAEQGAQAMSDAADRLERIAISNKASMVQVEELGDLAQQIGGVMDLIDDIAAQTKLIAFNASIEAAAAGEAGQRFAVVASQVRRLADRVAQSTSQIRARVEEIQTATRELIGASGQEQREIEAGLAVGKSMNSLLNQILTSAKETSLAVRQISQSTQEQQDATRQLHAELEPLTAGAQAIATGSRQTVEVMEDLVARAQELEEAVRCFQLPGSTE